ncbi:hypothetical protein BKI52_07880 [marine bacterium AO1-C]|nr:hypothetical protein BKI52_07880 [marine bacterium AO1-C]
MTHQEKPNLKQKQIIYDDTCPMCQWYTGAFVKYGFLSEQNRVSFTELDSQQLDSYQLDTNTARHEIPLVDLAGNQPIYGLDSLVYILQSRWSWIGTVMQIKPIKWFFKKLYTLVSYNRRVMAPTTRKATGFDCAPDFNMRYRMFFICMAWIVSGLISFHFTEQLWGNAGIYWFLSICSVWFVHYTFALKLTTQHRVEFWGQLATIKLIGTLVLLPSLWIASREFMFFNLGIATLLMLNQYLRRIVGYRKLFPSA